jgi:short subunit dehydrogenase-like uncharacterized protein
LAQAYGLDHRAFGLEDPSALDAGLHGMEIVLHCAGPFVHTYRAMAEACLRKGVHYLDITGELAVLEGLHRMNQEAHRAGVVLMPAAGFDVVPTDCMALHLAERCPEGDRMLLAFGNFGSRISHGTMSSLLTRIGEPGAERIAGRICPRPIGRLMERIDWGEGSSWCISIPWGDLFTAGISTGIPHIVTMTTASRRVHRILRFQILFNPLLRMRFVRRLLQSVVDRRAWGPTPRELNNGYAMVYGRLTGPAGARVEARLQLPESYRLTALSAVHLVQRISGLKDRGMVGFLTPAQAFGSGLITEIPGCRYLEGATEPRPAL